jgi:glutaminase
VFRGVPTALLAQVEQATRTQVYEQGERILSHGQQGDGRVFFIESGQVSILMPLRSGAHQRIATLWARHGIR